ncbi:MAG: choice-of-anchor Q domain-containing protein [Chloroflexota bacterium]
MPSRVLALAASTSLLASLLLAVPAAGVVTTLYVAHAAADETGTASGCTTPDFTTASLSDSAAIQAAVDDAAVNAAITTIHICGDAQWNLTATVHVDKDATYSLSFDGDGRSGASATVIDGADAVQLFQSTVCGTSCGSTYDAAHLTFSHVRLQNGLGAPYYINDYLQAYGITRGGAVGADGGAVHLVDVEVDSSSAQWGGAILADAVTVTDSVLDGNTASAAAGAIYSWGALAITGSTFTNNTSTASAGAVLARSTTISGSAFRHNRALVALPDVPTSEAGAVLIDNYASASASTITDTEFTDNSATYGGGVESSGPLEVTGSTFDANGAGGAGAAIFRFAGSAGSVTVTDSTFTTNHSDGSGGAVYVGDGLLTLAGTTSFSGNSADINGGAVWGGATVEAGAAVFDASTALHHGGAIYASGPVTIDGGSLTGNSAGSSLSDFGGAIYANGAVTLTNALVSGSSAGNGGAVYAANGFGISVTTSTLTANHADPTSGQGGALYTHGNVEITRSTASENTAASGGALFIWGDVTATNSTFAANSASGGGALYALTSGTLRNVTFKGNTAGDYGAIEGGSGPGSPSWAIDDTIFGAASDGCSFLGGGPVGNGNLTAAGGCPGTATTAAALALGVLADNGGPTQTVALGADSVALDSIAPVADACGTAADQRGTSRPQGAGCDAGAFEAVYVAPPADTTPPSAPGTPVVVLRTGASLTGSAIPVRVTWAASTDNVGGSGLAATPYTLERREGTGPWVGVTTYAGTSADTTVVAGKVTAFRVVARDVAGNPATGVASTARTYLLTQQTSAAVKYGGTWTKQSSALYSGGSLKYAKTAGRSASYTFTGRAIAFVTTRAAGRGKVVIFIDGIKVKTLDTTGATAYRWLAWSWGGTAKSHTIKIVVSGTAGRPRVDLDAFVVIK